MSQGLEQFQGRKVDEGRVLHRVIQNFLMNWGWSPKQICQASLRRALRNDVFLISYKLKGFSRRQLHIQKAITEQDITGLNKVQPDDKVYVAMSGGVDSSTIAAMLSSKFGTDRVEGVFMNNWTSLSKCQEASWRDVQETGRFLGIRTRRVDLEHDYWTEVFEPMLQAYQQGDTPNPDVSCNKYIKFGNLIKELKKQDPNLKWLASGHYVGLSPNENLVRRPVYLPKDQSYYLATVEPEILKHALFPLASKTKPDVRELARQLGLTKAANKPDSQGLCFVEQQEEFGARGFRKFLSEYLNEAPGPVVRADDLNNVVGEHRGLWTHTIGQRASVPMPQGSPNSKGKWFVVGKDKERNALIIDRGSNAPSLFTDRVVSKDFKWHRLPRSSDLWAQYRSLQSPWQIQSWTHNGDLVLTFKESRRAVAPGQYIVVYENDTIIGAGTIA